MLSGKTDKLQSYLDWRRVQPRVAASPGNFVAYQLYKRALESAGVTPTTGPANTNQEIQAAYNAALGFTPQGQPPVAGMTPTQAPAATGNTPLDDYLRRVQIWGG